MTSHVQLCALIQHECFGYNLSQFRIVLDQPRNRHNEIASNRSGPLRFIFWRRTSLDAVPHVANAPVVFSIYPVHAGSNTSEWIKVRIISVGRPLRTLFARSSI